LFFLVAHLFLLTFSPVRSRADENGATGLAVQRNTWKDTKKRKAS
jgi:hypothetical protein